MRFYVKLMRFMQHICVFMQNQCVLCKIHQTGDGGHISDGGWGSYMRFMQITGPALAKD